jgi:hypothetical protein
MNYFTCIIFFKDELERRPTKYRNIRYLANFKAYAASIGAKSINVYDKRTKDFVEQIKID